MRFKIFFGESKNIKVLRLTNKNIPFVGFILLKYIYIDFLEEQLLKDSMGWSASWNSLI